VIGTPAVKLTKFEKASASLLAVDGEGQRDVEGVVVLNQRSVLIVKDQLLQGAIKVVGFGKTEAGVGLVDDTVLHLSIHNYGAGVATRLAAVSDQEGSISLSSEQRLSLDTVNVPQTP
jgi:hypothetical protein